MKRNIFGLLLVGKFLSTPLGDRHQQ